MHLRSRQRLLAQVFAALAACLWGFTYSVSSAYLPALPLFDGGVRALLAGVALLLLARTRPGDVQSARFGLSYLSRRYLPVRLHILFLSFSSLSSSQGRETSCLV